MTEMMTRVRPEGLIYGIGALGLGLVCIAFGNFALQWQGVPDGVPAMPFAYLTGLLLVVAGALTVWRGTSLWGAALLTVNFGFWTFVLHGPRVAAAPGNIVIWLGFAEILSLAAAGALLVLMLDAKERPTHERAARIVYGACPLVFGLSHFAYADFTAGMVPSWIPFPLFWAYATGVGHVAAGASIIAGPLSRLAATLLTAMLGSFVLLLHVPRVIASPNSHIEWTMIFVATTLTGAAWIVRNSIPAKPTAT